MAPLLQIEGLTRRFGGVTAVNALSLAVDEGELVSIIGPNGAGKTTVFNLVTGLDAPDAGSVTLRGHRHHRPSGREARAARLRAHLPARPRVREPERARQCAGRRAHAARGGAPAMAGASARSPSWRSRWCARARSRPKSRRCAPTRWRSSRCSASGCVPRIDNPAFSPLLREPPPPRDRARAGAQAARAVPRRADRRHEPDRDGGDARDHPHA